MKKFFILAAFLISAASHANLPGYNVGVADGCAGAGGGGGGCVTLLTVSSPGTYAAGDTIPTSYGIMRVSGASGAVTLTSVPSVADGTADAQILTIEGTNDSAVLTIQDDSVLAGSNFFLDSGTSFSLGQYDSISFMWHSGVGWIETSRVDI